MSQYNVIADVSESMRKVLWEHMRGDKQIFPAIIDSEDDIALVSPEETTETGKLSIFLYLIEQNPFLKNQPMERKGPNSHIYAPVPLTLFYLLTPTADEQKKDHILLGKVIQVFHDNAVIRGPELTGSLEGSSHELRVVMHSLPFDQLLQLWQSFPEKNFKLSVCYQVTPVYIDSARSLESQPIKQREHPV